MLDKSKMFHTEGMYNFSRHIPWFDLQAGVSYRYYSINSEGTVFADTPGNPISINQYGGYVQLDRRFLKDQLRVTLAARYDKGLGEYRALLLPKVPGGVEHVYHLYVVRSSLRDALHDYLIATSCDAPEMDSTVVPSYEPRGPYGGKECGEGSTLPLIGAIANAVSDAIGVRVSELPITPERVRALIRQRERSGQVEE